ncbi:hypothetical protein FLK61_33585 [Paenalkalicoccus suaedae]|uniref:Uncharacterized protein n=1 Tax=Paenalkalicoccus suaedae TaxID=2592382 RepID=A0A859FFK0_9BACI|nr:hypothetical protein [Paenalkalicoccus suaedae]QKS71620.1 hypothetical protein FLK61_33585 [Paenalkalicoccus suaedae]
MQRTFLESITYECLFFVIGIVMAVLAWSNVLEMDRSGLVIGAGCLLASVSLGRICYETIMYMNHQKEARLK